MVKIGINENVVLSNITKNITATGGSIEVFFKQVVEQPMNLFEKTLGKTVKNEEVNSGSVRIWGFKVPDYKDAKGNQLDPTEKRTRVVTNITQTKNQILHIIEQYLTTSEFDIDWYRGSGIDKDNYMEKYLEQDALNAMFENIADQMIEILEKFFNDEEYKMRLKIIRQSKEKNYPTLPSKYIESNPFLEPMKVPKEETRVKFSAYEIKEGLDKGDDVVETENADALPEATGEMKKSIFGDKRRRGA